MARAPHWNLHDAALAATDRLIAAGKSATPEMANEAFNATTSWMKAANAASERRWAEIAKRFPAGGGAKLNSGSALPKGMSVGSAVLGAVAIGGGVYLASRLFAKPKERQPRWADQVMAERRQWDQNLGR